ncbi:MAG TPA: carboxypeptidase regulatory-like domain-containing protein [Candidatus Binatia bacterium]|nr:carboxypeptidase regulatory-like domain-containing protein [Terriglobales bacterium]HXJ85529.1 carboxypeptidase regulatory-like domain-containing protein [Candidatus Binatia bacterium]
MSRRSHALLAVVLLSLTPALSAQSTSASISGHISDPTKARIVDAKVAAVNSATNARSETVTNAGGEYSLPGVPPGGYRLEVEKHGFRKLVKPDVVVHVQDALDIDFEMQVGATSDSITVQAGAPLLNTADATVSTVVDQHFIDNIPLNGRTVQTLIMLTPGVVVTQTAFDDQGQFSVNGQRADANYLTVDGVSANFGVTGYGPLVQTAGGALAALSVSGGTNSLVSVDAMQEFRVQTSSFAPEFGRTPGGQLAVVTRSGTNAFHGTLFEYFRNSALDANDWFANHLGLPKPAERQNDFGGVFGGPIIKDKTFFFVSYEGLRLRLPSTQETVVPSTPSRQQAQQAGLSILPYLNAYPIANGADLGAGLAQFNATYSNPSSLDAFSLRVDQMINPKVTLFGRYNYSPSDLTLRGPFSAPNTALSTTESVSSSIQTFTLGSTQLIRPDISNEFRANYSNQRVGTKYSLDNFGGAVPLPDSVLFPSGYSSSNALFEFLILGAGEYAQGKYGIDEQRQVNLIDNLSIAKGSHQLKLGVDYRWLSPFSSPVNYAPFAEFKGMSTTPGGALSDTALAAFVHNVQANTLLAWNLSLYGQDTWRVTPQLTLTYGLRWDLNPALKGKNLENQPFTVTGLDDPATLALAPRGISLYDTSYGNVAPRIGIAYQFGGNQNWTSVLRAGFGIFYDLGYGSLGGVSSYFPYQAVKSLSLVPFPLSAANAAPPPLTTNPPVSNILVAQPNLSTPYTYQWNVALEQSIGENQSLSLTYVGAAGRDLLRVTNLYNPNPNFQQVSVTSNSATSDYDALQIKFERRLSRGWQALASYTWSHSIDIASTDAFATYLNTPISIANPDIDRASSDFDIRHTFTAGVTYIVPTPQSNSFARATLGGWTVDTFLLARTAPPVDVTGGLVVAAGTVLKPRPNVVPGVPLELYGSQYPGGKIFNSAAFTTPPKGEQGNFPRNYLRGFAASQVDFALQREFKLTEKLNLRFRGEFFNLFNHPNFGSPNNSLTSPLFGYSTQTLANSLGTGGANGGLNPLYQIGGPRSIQLALKLQF